MPWAWKRSSSRKEGCEDAVNAAWGGMGPRGMLREGGRVPAGGGPPRNKPGQGDA